MWSQSASTVGSKNCPGPGPRLPPHTSPAPFPSASCDVLLGDVDLLREDDRADVDEVLRGIALPELARRARHALDERLVHGVVRVDALDRDADLPAVGEAAEDDRARRALEVAVRARDERRLAAELHHARDEPRAARRRDPPARLHAAGEDEYWMPASMSACPVGP